MGRKSSLEAPSRELMKAMQVIFHEVNITLDDVVQASGMTRVALYQQARRGVLITYARQPIRGKQGRPARPLRLTPAALKFVGVVPAAEDEE